MGKLLQFFSESNGQLSNTRLNTTVAAWVAFSMPVMSMIDTAFKVDWPIFVTLLTYSGGTKIFQKALEGKNGKTPEAPKP